MDAVEGTMTSTELLWLVWLSGGLAVGSLGEIILRWRGKRTQPRSGGAAAVSLGARICLVGWCYVLAVRAAVSARLQEHGPQELWGILDRLAYGALLAAAGGVVISAIGAASWLVRSIVLSRRRRV